MTSFSEAVARREAETCPKCGKPSASPPAEVYCVDCATEGWEKDAEAHRAVARVAPDGPLGTPLEEAEHEALVDMFLQLQASERQLREWKTQVEDELVRRHGDRRAAQVVGDHEVDIDRGFTRVWDVEDLWTVVRALIAEGKIPNQDAYDLIKREERVDGRKAAQLLNRVEGDALVELRRCFTWQQKGRAKVKVTPVAQLEP